MWITLASAGGIVFGGLTTQHYALLVRQMRFDAIALVQTLPQLAAVMVGIGLAMAGAGYWALVIMGIVGGAGTALVSWIASGWRPGLPSRSSGVGSMLAFGGHLTGFSLLSYLTRNADNIVIGRFLGPGPLGIYSKAYALLIFPVQQINAPVNGVVLPALCRLQHQPDQYRRYFLRAIEGLAFIGMPIILFAFADARSLVLTLLGPRWSGAVPIFRLLAPAALVGTINSTPTWIFTSLGRTDRQFRWALISAPIILAGFILGLHWGAAGVAASFSITFSLCFVLFVLDACRHSPIRLRDLAIALFPPFCASTAAALVTGVTGLHLQLSAVVGLALNACIFTVAYAAFSLAFPSGRSLLRSLLTQGGLTSWNCRAAES
jgi:PST family polysaccharide transporter